MPSGRSILLPPMNELVTRESTALSNTYGYFGVFLKERKKKKRKMKIRIPMFPLHFKKKKTYTEVAGLKRGAAAAAAAAAACAVTSRDFLRPSSVCVTYVSLLKILN